MAHQPQYILPAKGDTATGRETETESGVTVVLLIQLLELKPKTEKVLDMCKSITDDVVLLRRAERSFRAITGAIQHVCVTHMSANTLVQHPREQHLPRDV